MSKRIITFVASAGITVAILFATLGPRDYSSHHCGHHHWHQPAQQEQGSGT